MGEAKRRGTFEQRKDKAIVRQEAERIISDNAADIRDAKRGRHYSNGRINPTLMGLYLNAMSKKGATNG